MEKYLTIFILSLSFTSFGQNCSMLENGKYEITYFDKKVNPSLFEIVGNHYYTFQDGTKKEFEIKMLSKCSFELKDNEKVDETKLTEFQKVIAKLKPFFEITKVEENVYYFVCIIDLHVQCGNGKFTKKE